MEEKETVDLDTADQTEEPDDENEQIDYVLEIMDDIRGEIHEHRIYTDNMFNDVQNYIDAKLKPYVESALNTINDQIQGFNDKLSVSHAPDINVKEEIRKIKQNEAKTYEEIEELKAEVEHLRRSLSAYHPKQETATFPVPAPVKKVRSTKSATVVTVLAPVPVKPSVESSTALVEPVPSLPVSTTMATGLIDDPIEVDP